ncbi:hypothetical protein AB0K15_21150 [Amycolatopsis sp. NPDC049253]|uniref:peptidoglycan-binding domain-containing protein n=1 Tax=Amycolatopsis sp. NPDC049253 TaxID=3155274 RepID=UPI00343BB58D
MVTNPRRVVLVLMGVALAAGAGGWVVGSRITSPADAAAAHQPPPASLITVAVRKQKLTSTVTAQGTIAYTGATPLTLTGSVGAPAGDAATAATQLVTKAPEAGATVGSGARLLEVSGRPVFLLPGAVPMYRTLSDGMTGDDVEQLQAALTALGFGHPRGGKFDAATQIQVKRWYERAGYEPQTTADTPPKVTIPSGEILFLPELPVRLDSVTTRAGAQATGRIGTATSSKVDLRGTLPTADAQLVRAGMTAKLSLPDGTTASAKVDATGPDAAPSPADDPAAGNPGNTDGSGDQASGTGQAGGAGQQPAAADAVPVRFAAADPKALAAYAGQAVRIDIEVGATSGDVLVVPVAAVVTSADGTTRVQVQRAGGAVDDVAVRTGLTADGLVEVTATGGALAAGDRVAVGTK